MKALLALSVLLLSQNAGVAETSLPPDRAVRLGALEAVCTGVGLDSRSNPAWSQFPLKIEIAGRGGQFLGDVELSLLQNGQQVAGITCDGPWILFRLAPGRYLVSARTEGITVQSQAIVPAIGQGRVILRFPELGGQISAPAQAGAHE